MTKMIDLTGQIFNQLTVLRRDLTPGSLVSRKGACWICKCTCGKLITAVPGTYLTRGITKSCGCHKYIDMTNSKVWYRRISNLDRHEAKMFRYFISSIQRLWWKRNKNM